MKNFIPSLFLILAVLIPTAHADLQGAPFLPEEDARFNALEQGNHINISNPQGAADGHSVKQVVQATYDFAKQTGAIGSYDLGVTIPKGAIITRSVLWSLTQPTTSASGTLAWNCGSYPLFKAATAAASYGAASAAIEGVQTGTAANMSTVTANCNVKAQIATGALTAGKVTAFIEYVTHQ